MSMVICLIIALVVGKSDLFAASYGEEGEFHSNAMLSSTSSLLSTPAFFMDLGSDEMFSRFEVYPNPSSGTFLLNFKTDMRGSASITIYNVLGKQVHSEDLKDFKGAFKGAFDLNFHPNGFYFLQIRIGKEVYQHKLVLSKQ